MSNLLIANQKKFWSTGQLVPVPAWWMSKYFCSFPRILWWKVSNSPAPFSQERFMLQATPWSATPWPTSGRKGRTTPSLRSRSSCPSQRWSAKFVRVRPTSACQWLDLTVCSPVWRSSYQLHSLYREDDEGLRHERQRGEDPHWLQPHHEGEVRLAGRP